MPTDKHLVMYSRTFGCPFVTIAKSVLHEHDIAYQEVFIDKDEVARQRVLDWTGFLSVPTLVIAEQGSTLPYTDVVPLPVGASPRGVDRGPLLTEANIEQLTTWLSKHDFIE